VENNQNDLELVFGESAETLWANFEKTGSVRAYLLYLKKSDPQKSGAFKEVDPLYSPS
jgi:hypothetical protein